MHYNFIEVVNQSPINRSTQLTLQCSFYQTILSFFQTTCAPLCSSNFTSPSRAEASKEKGTNREPLPSQSLRQRPNKTSSTIQKPLGQVHCTVRLYSWNVTLLARSESTTPRHSPHGGRKFANSQLSGTALETFPSGHFPSSFSPIRWFHARTQFVFKGDECIVPATENLSKIPKNRNISSVSSAFKGVFW